MKNLIVFGIFILVLVFAQFAQAQTVDDVINKYIDAMGGKEKMMSLNTVKMSGSFNVQGIDVAVTITKKHMIGTRADFSINGTENYQIVTADKGSVFMPIQGQAAPEPMSDDQLKMGQTQLDVQGSLFNYKEKGNDVVLAGKETIDGTECYKLNVTFKNGNKTNYYISSKDNRICKTSTKMTINGEEADVETTYSNYKQNAGGFWFAYTTVSTRGETNYDSIETNIAVDDSIFKN